MEKKLKESDEKTEFFNKAITLFNTKFGKNI